MSLESDFCTTHLPDSLKTAMTTLAWETLRSYSAPKYAPSTWVKLLNPPTAFSFDEAWLLCQYEDNQWLAWIPDYGELLLHTDEFCSLTDRSATN